MTARLTLICHGSTDAVRSAAFPGDEPLDHYGKTAAAELVGRLPSADCCWTKSRIADPTNRRGTWIERKRSTDVA
jgi:broad specificity phosphatase PhoE